MRLTLCVVTLLLLTVRKVKLEEDVEDDELDEPVPNKVRVSFRFRWKSGSVLISYDFEACPRTL